MKNYVMFSLFLMNFLHGAEHKTQKKPLKVFVIPGQNDLGLNTKYVARRTGLSPEDIYRVKVPENRKSFDFGQSGCMKELEDTLKKNKNEFIIYSSSYDTATTLIFFSK